MALRSGAPVIPCAMVGTFELQPPGRTIPRLGRVTIRFGAPLDFSRFAGLEGERYAVRTVTDEIMYEVLALSG
ncbi:1-acyl-sn-glycerol-3-phosphate acyltransferase, partial [Streptomyces sp. DvalAA-14]